MYLAENVENKGISGFDQPAEPPRVAFAIPRAVGPAVMRNRVRRRLRALLGDRVANGSLASGAWLVVARPPAGEWSAMQLGEALDGALGVLGAQGATHA